MQMNLDWKQKINEYILIDGFKQQKTKKVMANRSQEANAYLARK